MTPGPELDALIAVEVMGLPGPWCPHTGIHIPCGPPRPRGYSTDISAAWEVAGRFKVFETIVDRPESYFLARLDQSQCSGESIPTPYA